MQFRELRYVVTLARVLNFTRAAEELGITQPVLSRSIQAIEQRHKLRFFDREKGRVHLTAAGRDFSTRAAVVLREVEELETRLQRTASGETGELFFGMTPVVAKAVMPSVILECLRAAPDLDLRAVVRPTPVFPALLEAQDIEFFISSRITSTDSPGIKSALLGHFPVTPMVRPGHPLVTTPDVGHHRFRKLSTTRLSGSPFTPSLLPPCVEQTEMIVIEDLDSLIHVAETTDAIFVGTPFAAMESLDSGRLVLLPMPENGAGLRVDIMMYSLNGRTLSPLAVRVKEAVRSSLRALWRQLEEGPALAALAPIAGKSSVHAIGEAG